MSDEMRRYLNIMESAIFGEDSSDGSEAFSYGASKERFTAHEYEQMHSLIKGQGNLTSAEINAIAKDNAADWPRGYRSLRLALIRLYVLITGDIPDGMTPAPEWYNLVSEEMISFAESKGYDVDTNFVEAEEKARERREAKQKQVNYENAKKKMAEYWQQVKNSFSKSEIKKLKNKRDEIINMIKSGESPEDAFSKAINELQSNRGKRDTSTNR